EQVSKPKHSRNQGVLACKMPKRETLFELAYISQLLFPSDLAMEKREESNKRDSWEWKSAIKTAAGKGGLELENNSDLVQIDRRDFIKMGRVKKGDEKGGEKLGQNG
ncbi:unnamed protein product, partial [Prunus brigantina]